MCIRLIDKDGNDVTPKLPPLTPEREAELKVQLERFRKLHEEMSKLSIEELVKRIT